MGLRRALGVVERRILCLGLALMGVGCSNSESTAPPPPEVSVSKPLLQDVTDWDEYSGRFDAIESVEVRARVSGYLAQINFQEGAIVEKGQVLLVIDPRPAQATLDRAKAELQEALTRRDLAIADLRRGEVLRQERAISQEEYDQRVQAQQASLASESAARAAVRTAELDLEFTSVRAPISGRVGRREVSSGNLVSGGGASSTLLTTIYSLDPIYFVFDADEAAYLKYVRMNAAGQRRSSRDAANPVRLRLIDEDTFEHVGRMNFVDNHIDVRTGTMLGRAIFDNPGTVFIPGMFGRLQLLGSGTYQALMVPDAAIVSDQSQKLVMTLDAKDTVVPKTVTLGSLQGELRVIRTGLAPDDRVIVDGLMRVQPGVTVKPKPTVLAGSKDLAK